MSEIVIELVHVPIDIERVASTVNSEYAGANILFIGTARKLTNGIETLRLEYDCHAPMAEAKLRQVAESACEKFDLVACHIVHRLGMVELKEASIVLGVGSAHRLSAIHSIEWIMDQIKVTVPIWKKEHLASGESEWVHHGEKPKDIHAT